MTCGPEMVEIAKMVCALIGTLGILWFVYRIVVD